MRFALAFRNKLICMYVKYGSLDDARKIFDEMKERDNFSWNTIIAAYRRHGNPQEAVALFHQMQETGFQPDCYTFTSVLPACAEVGSLEQGMGIHQSIIDTGILSNVVVETALVDMYAKCGCLDKACQLFDKIPQKNVVSWNVMIIGYARNGFMEKALETFNQMQLAGVKPDSVTFASILPACAKMRALEQGMGIHQSIMALGFSSNIVIRNAVLDMYAKCGRVDKVIELFDRMPQKDVVSWTVMIAGYSQNGFFEKGLETFRQMLLSGVEPNSTTFASVLPACAKMRALEQGRDIHRRILEGGFFSDIVGSSLLYMYAKCGRVDKANELFDRMPQRDVISWNAIIAGYAYNGFVDKALETLKKMQLAGVKPTSATFASILRACAKMGVLEHGMDIHQSIKDGEIMWDVVIATALVDMYAKCGRIDKARELFDIMPLQDVVSWTAMVTGYAHNGFSGKALETFKQMQLAGVKPDSKTFASIFTACAKLRDLEQGMKIHQSIKDAEILSDVVVATALVHMYAKCGSIDKAAVLFDRMPQRNVFSWTAMISGYLQNGFNEKAFETFKQMQLAGVKPNSTTFANVFPACATVEALKQGMNVHQSIKDRGILSDTVATTALIDMYAKCGSINKALELFDKMDQRDVCSWTAMIAGYAQNGFLEEALKTFKQMQFVGVRPDITTFASIFHACAKMGALEQGMDIHESMEDKEILSDVVVATALVDMYAKCGSIDKARELFERMPERDVVSWNTMIAGYAQNGFCEDALNVFELMKDSGTYPDVVTFACVLYACSHAGLVDEGCAYFNHMINPYCITPTIDHFACMVDLLARAGYLAGALNFIIKMPVTPVVVVWMCFLGACRSHMNIGLGVFAAKFLIDLDPNNAATYVLLSNIYAEVGRWDEVQIIRRLMKDRGIKKIPGRSWIDGHKMVDFFTVGDVSHPQTQDIYPKMERMAWEMKPTYPYKDGENI